HGGYPGRGAQSAFTLGLLHGAGRDFAQLAARANAGPGERLCDPARTDAPAGDEPFQTLLGGGGGSVSALGGSRGVARSPRHVSGAVARRTGVGASAVPAAGE